MLLSTGTKVGHYEIVAPIGAGGMGEVYRARDTRLKRDVALKVLPDVFARDPDRMARFQREAELLASLNHPNIAHLYGVEERALVMELVEGDSPKGPMAFDDAWRIALQIADALEYAHEKGVVHRDLKPANVKVTPEGVVKLLDFGLAKALREQASASDVTISETLTMGATEVGVVLGTVSYMSPEQAMGKPVDKRTDIFSWGVVLYELLTGRRLFKGEDTAETLRQVLGNEPDLDAVPPQVRRLLRRCLEKQPKLRLRDIGEARFLLEDSAAPGIAAGVAAKSKWVWWPLAAACAAALVLGIGFWRLAAEPQSPDMTQYRFRPFATEDYAETNPVWSPDGKSIAYAANPKSGSELRVRSIDGSPPVTLAVGKGTGGSQGINQPSWTPDGSTLYYIDAPDINFGPVFSVSRAGGEPMQVTKDLAFAAAISPDGKTLAALMRENSGGKGQRVLTLTSPPGLQPKRLAVFPGMNVQNRVAWSPDGSKILVWLQSPDTNPDSSIWLVNVSTGESKQIASPPDTLWANFSWFPDNRRVAIAWPRGDPVEDRSDLAIFDTVTGRHTLMMPSAEDMADPSVSPDGKTIAFQTGRLDFDVVEFPLDGSAPRPLVATKQWEDSPDWSPVAPEFVYVSGDAIWLRGRNSAGREMESRPVVDLTAFPGRRFRFASPSFSPDGTKIVYHAANPHATKVFISPVSGGAPAPLGDFIGDVRGITWSPDGRWIAVNWTPAQSNESRLSKIRLGSGQSTTLAKESCASAPAWSPDSSRILCSSGDILYTIPAEGGQREFLGKEYEPIAAWSREMHFIYAIRDKDGKRELGKLDWKSGAFQPIVAVPLEWTFGPPDLGGERLSLAPDGKSLATTIAKLTGEIWILEGFQEPPTLWQRLMRH
jgi:Tol biopolymer transport system component